MTIFAPMITLACAALLAMFAYSFYPWQGNMLGDANLVGVPLWVGCVALAFGLVAVTVRDIRVLVHTRRSTGS